jgi:hypothetical protein
MPLETANGIKRRSGLGLFRRYTSALKLTGHYLNITILVNDF